MLDSQLIELALEEGFTAAGPLDPATLVFMPEVREMCAADKCRKFGRCWICPPACGTLEECEKKASGYRRGLLVQTVGAMEDEFDIETIEETQRRQQSAFSGLGRRLLPHFPRLLMMGSGSCRFCEGECTYPNAPCRHPQLAHPSMEAHGLLVSDVCEKNALPYYYGKNTISFTSCYLLE